MTVQEIINASYNKIGLLVIATTKSDKALVSLNNMISSWSAEGLIVPYRTSESFSLVVGQSSYTIGTGGEFNTVRPLEIISAYIRDSSSSDHPVSTTMTQQQYADIVDKTISTRPGRLYYDPQYALGKIYFESKPDTVETIYLTSEKAITEFASLTAAVVLPDYYKEALVYNLAIRLALDEEIEINQYVTAIAITSKNTIENIAAKDKLFRISKMDNALLNNNNSFNILTG